MSVCVSLVIGDLYVRTWRVIRAFCNNAGSGEDEADAQQKFGGDQFCKKHPSKENTRQVVNREVLDSGFGGSIFLHREYVKAEHEDVSSNHK